MSTMSPFKITFLLVETVLVTTTEAQLLRLFGSCTSESSPWRNPASEKNIGENRAISEGLQDQLDAPNQIIG